MVTQNFQCLTGGTEVELSLGVVNTSRGTYNAEKRARRGEAGPLVD